MGLVGVHDPTRPEVPAAIAACRRAGVRVVILTGDYPVTARSVAAAVGLSTADRLVEPEIDAMDDRALVELLRAGASLARTTPEQKLRVVQVLRRSGEVVVVTGDGVNDAPALRAADVGAAMGLRGTEVAKQVADILLSDDNFATIVAAIEEGRAIKQNIRRFVSYLFTSNVAELVPFAQRDEPPAAHRAPRRELAGVQRALRMSDHLALDAARAAPLGGSMCSVTILKNLSNSPLVGARSKSTPARKGEARLVSGVPRLPSVQVTSSRCGH